MNPVFHGVLVFFHGLVWCRVNPGLEVWRKDRHQLSLLDGASLLEASGKGNKKLSAESCRHGPELWWSPRIMPVLNGGLQNNGDLLKQVRVGWCLVCYGCNAVADAQG